MHVLQMLVEKRIERSFHRLNRCSVFVAEQDFIGSRVLAELFDAPTIFLISFNGNHLILKRYKRADAHDVGRPLIGARSMWSTRVKH